MNWSALESWLLVRGGPRGQGWAPSTVEQRLGDLRRAAREGEDLEAFSVDQGEAFLAHLVREGISPSGYNNYVIALNALARYHSLEHRWEPRAEPDPQHDYLSDDEIHQLLGYEHSDRTIHLRDRAEVLVALQTALRPSEAYRLTVDSFDRDEHTVLVEKTSKQGLRRRLPVEPWVLSPKRPLGAWLNYLEDHELDDAETIWLAFPRDPWAGPHPMSEDYFRDRLRQIGESVGVDVDWQTTRRSRAQRLLDQGWALPYVSRYLGHNDVATTQAYLELSDERMIEEMHAKPTEDPLQRTRED